VPELLLARAEDQAEASANAAEVGEADLATIDRKIARLERAAGERLAAALAAGADPKVAAAAAGSLQAEIGAARRQRKTLTAWAADAAERHARAEVLARVAEQAGDALRTKGDVAAKQCVLEALGVKVSVIRWALCEGCGGSGRLRGRGPNKMCPGCCGMRYKVLVEVTGSIPAVAHDSGAEPWPVRLVAS
jgi:hypothetical protein